MKIWNSIAVLMFMAANIFYTSCGTKAVAPDACMQIKDEAGTIITSAKLNQQIYFVNCGDKYVLNAIYPGVKVPLAANITNVYTGVVSTGKPQAYGVTGSSGLIIPPNTLKAPYIYGENTSVTGAMTITYITSDVEDGGNDIARTIKTYPFTVTPD
jgi:hypothetical protein